MNKVVELIIRGKDLSGRAIASAAAGMARLRVAASSAFAGIRATAANAFRGFGERMGQRAFDGLKAGAASFLRGTVGAAAEAEAGVNSLRHTLGKLGLQYTSVAGQVDAAVGRVMEASYFDDDEILGGFDKLLKMTKDYQFSLQSVALVADIAFKENMSLADAAALIGKAYNGNTRALKAFGISTKDGAKAIAELHKRFDGAARQGLETTSGQAKAAARDLGELQEEIGENVIPVVHKLSEVVRLLTRWVRENSGTVKTLVVIFGVLFGVIGPLIGLVSGLASGAVALAAALTSATGAAVGVGAVVAVGAPLLLGLAALSALFIKNRVDALNAAAAANAYRNSLLALSEAELAKESTRVALETIAAQDAVDELKRTGGYERRSRRHRAPDDLRAARIAEPDAPLIVTDEGREADARLGRWEQRLDAVRAAIEHQQHLAKQINAPQPDTGSGPATEEAKKDKKDPERERIDALRQAAELGILTNAERREAVRLEREISARIAAGIPDAATRVDAQGKVNDLREIQTVDQERELTLLERAQGLHALTPALIERARAGLADVNQQLGAGNLGFTERLDLMERAARYQEVLRAPLEEQIQLLQQAAALQALTPAMLDRARAGLAQVNAQLASATLSERDRMDAIAQRAQLQEVLRAPLEAEIAALEEAAQLRELDAAQMARLVELTGSLAALSAAAAGDRAEQSRIAGMEQRAKALGIATQEKEIERLTEARQLRRLTPDERGRLALLRVQLEEQIKVNAGTAEELRLRRLLAQVDPASGGSTGEERDKRGAGWGDVSAAGIGESIRSAIGPLEDLQDVIGRGLVDAMYTFGDATAEAMEGLVTGSSSAGDALAGGLIGGLRDAAKGLAKYYLAYGGAMIGEGWALKNPAKIAGGLKMIAGGMALSAVSGALSGAMPGSSGGGSGGGSRERNEQSADRLRREPRARAELRIKGGRFIDSNDPAEMEALVRAVQAAEGRDLYIIR